MSNIKRNLEANLATQSKLLAEAEALELRLRGFIKRYAHHHGDCNIYASKIEGVQPDGGICKCGFEHDMEYLSASPSQALEEYVAGRVREALELPRYLLTRAEWCKDDGSIAGIELVCPCCGAYKLHHETPIHSATCKLNKWLDETGRLASLAKPKKSGEE